MLTSGVLPAIEKLISSGVADAGRLFVAGHSFGGFSTYGLVTQTDRFKAAVALSGWSDFLSTFGTSDPRLRYGEDLKLMFYGMGPHRKLPALYGWPTMD